MHPAPPQLPPKIIYTSCWCEENIYLLLRNFLEQPAIAEIWDVFAVFISNKSKTVALWNQKLTSDETIPVVWDYHAVLILRARARDHAGDNVLLQGDERVQSWVYDFDTRLPTPCTLKDYLAQTFKDVTPQYESLFRVIPGVVYLNHFSSDRSHMLSDEVAPAAPVYLSPPPSYPPISGYKAVERGTLNNLMTSFVSMIPSEDTYGDVLDNINQLALW